MILFLSSFYSGVSMCWNFKNS